MWSLWAWEESLGSTTSSREGQHCWWIRNQAFTATKLYETLFTLGHFLYHLVSRISSINVFHDASIFDDKVTQKRGIFQEYYSPENQYMPWKCWVGRRSFRFAMVPFQGTFIAFSGEVSWSTVSSTENSARAWSKLFGKVTIWRPSWWCSRIVVDRQQPPQKGYPGFQILCGKFGIGICLKKNNFPHTLVRSNRIRMLCTPVLLGCTKTVTL